MVIIFFLIPYSCMTVCLNSCPMNSLPLSNVIWVGQGYLESHSCSAILATVIALLSSYWCISNQPDAGSIIVTHLHTRSGLPLRLILYGPIRSMHILSHIRASASLGGKWPYFFCFLLFFWQVGQA